MSRISISLRLVKRRELNVLLREAVSIEGNALRLGKSRHRLTSLTS